jgi:hypothetical protein
MPHGKSDIPDLRLENLQKLISSFTAAPDLVLTGMFGAGENAITDNIEWESIIGNRGLTPFAAPGAPAQATAPGGLAKHFAAAAYWKEKMAFDEVFLNNLRQPGTVNTYESAQARLARETRSLRSRCDRRKEWMYAQMLSAGSFSYSAPKGVKISVDYGVPSSNIVTLSAARQWDSGSQRNILEDVMDAKLVIQSSCGGVVDTAMMTTEVLKMLILDSGIQTLVSKSNFGDGSLLARPNTVLSGLLEIPNWYVYDEQYQITAWLTAVVTGTSTTAVSVDDASDFVAGGTLRFHDVSAGTYEDETISSVDVEAGTVTVATAPAASFKAGEDKVTMTKKFLPIDKFIMFASSVEGNKIAGYFNAPFGLNRSYGLYVDTHEEWDPEVMWIRVQNKGLPVLYNRDALYVMTVT